MRSLLLLTPITLTLFGSSSAHAFNTVDEILLACSNDDAVEAAIHDKALAECGLDKKGDLLACDAVSGDPEGCKTLTPSSAPDKRCSSANRSVNIQVTIDTLGWSGSGSLSGDISHLIEAKQRERCRTSSQDEPSSTGGTYVRQHALVSMQVNLNVTGSLSISGPGGIPKIDLSTGGGCNYSKEIEGYKESDAVCALPVEEPEVPDDDTDDTDSDEPDPYGGPVSHVPTGGGSSGTTGERSSDKSGG